MDDKTLQILKAKNRAYLMFGWTMILYFSAVGLSALLLLFIRWDAIQAAGQ